MTMIKLIALDIDDTLLNSEGGRFSLVQKLL